MNIRLRVLPTISARVQATNGFTVDKEGADFVVRPDYGQLSIVPAVPDQNETFFSAWTRDQDDYSIIPFSGLVANIQDVIIGPNLAAIAGVTTDDNTGVYFTGEAEAATYSLTEYFRSLSGTDNLLGLSSAMGLYEEARANIFYSPTSASDPAVDLNNPGTLPTGTADSEPGINRYSNVIWAPGATNYNADQIWRSTIVGAGAFKVMEKAERTDVFGNSAMRWARFSERNTALGSLVMQWLGQDLTRDPTNAFYHDLFYPTSPANIAWNPDGVATNDPSVRATLAAFTGWATDRTQVVGNVGIGRDSVLELVKGSYNTGTGYKSLWLLFNGSENSGFGYEANQHLIFGSGNSAFGSRSGMGLSQGSFNSFLGNVAGRDFVRGSNNLFLGYLAGGAGITDANRSVFLGNGAGNGMGPSLDDVFVLANQPISSYRPLLTGKFDLGRLGINTLYSEIGTQVWQVRDQSGNPLQVVDTSGRTIFGFDTSTSVGGIAPRLQVVGGSASTAAISAVRYAASSGGSFLMLGKSRSATIGAFGIVSNGDELGRLQFNGDDGSALVNGGYIAAFVDGAPGAGDMPSRLDFFVNVDGSASPTRRFSLTSTGIGFNGNSPVSRPSVTGSRGGNAALTSLLSALDSMGLITNSTT